MTTASCDISAFASKKSSLARLSGLILRLLLSPLPLISLLAVALKVGAAAPACCCCLFAAGDCSCGGGADVLRVCCWICAVVVDVVGPAEVGGVAAAAK